MQRTAVELHDMSRTVSDDLDDLAVLPLFSIFEANVRARATADVNREMALINHVAVKQAVKELKEATASGSFAKVTAAYQKMDTDLTAQVNQVRKFRNWVAHGRRDMPENQVTPEGAFQQLGRYLEC
jgi:glutamine synthetase type III